MANKMAVAVINESTVVSDEDVQDLVAALQDQVDNDFSPIWGRGAQLSIASKTEPTPVGVWVLVILDNSDQAGALGYHDLTRNGDPLGKVFAGDDIKDGESWTNTASHELLEMLADPWINLVAEAGDKFYAYEVCDAVEDDSLGYKKTAPNGKIVLVSDFVLPNWFTPESSGPFDYLSHVTEPLQLLINGYISVFDGKSWGQLNGKFDGPEKEARSAPKEGHRRFKRAHRKEWKKSTAGA